MYILLFTPTFFHIYFFFSSLPVCLFHPPGVCVNIFLYLCKQSDSLPSMSSCSHYGYVCIPLVYTHFDSLTNFNISILFALREVCTYSSIYVTPNIISLMSHFNQKGIYRLNYCLLCPVLISLFPYLYLLFPSREVCIYSPIYVNTKLHFPHIPFQSVRHL